MQCIEPALVWSFNTLNYANQLKFRKQREIFPFLYLNAFPGMLSKA